MNGSPDTVEELNDLPIKTVGGDADLHPRRRARARRLSAADQHRPRRRPARRAAHDPEDRQRLDARHHRPRQGGAAAASPPACRRSSRSSRWPTSRSSSRAAISGVIREAVIAACLTALMILLFLGSWRSTIIIAVSIPLSILTSIIVLSALGETINIMTLGGLALAVGILVDDATVAIENINSHLEQGKPLEPAILDGAQQIAVPAFVSTLCICIVFVPMFFLTGVARYLFVPMAEAVVFAMLASYVLSRTLVPTMAKYLLKAHQPARADAGRAESVRAAAARRSTTASCACAAATASTLERLPRRAGGCSPARSCSSASSRFVLLPVGRPGLLPGGRQRPVQAAPPRADRHAHRGDGASLRSGRRRRSATIIPREELGEPHRQHRAALQRPEPSYTNSAPIGAAGRRHPGLARPRITGRRPSTFTTCGSS